MIDVSLVSHSTFHDHENRSRSFVHTRISTSEENPPVHTFYSHAAAYTNQLNVTLARVLIFFLTPPAMENRSSTLIQPMRQSTLTYMPVQSVIEVQGAYRDFDPQLYVSHALPFSIVMFLWVRQDEIPRPNSSAGKDRSSHGDGRGLSQQRRLQPSIGRWLFRVDHHTQR